ncbi:MAG: NAD(P)-dependent oxidoreductase [Burkholderiaceae bacterium]|nr:MAG: NAD(P)-dependent oxidoreductase [Burkholderiaceae bacterium]
MTRAYLGTGLLGAAFVRAMLRRKQAVRVWNRTAAKAQALTAEGAEMAPSPGAAVEGADIVHLTLRDDAAVDEVLASARPHLKPGALILDHTTTSVGGARQRAADWSKAGLRYLHAPVLMAPQHALDATGLMMVSGAPALIAQAMPELGPMTGEVLNLGDDPGVAAATKLAVNLYSVAMMSGLSDVLSLAQGAGLPLDTVKRLFGQRDMTGLTLGMLDRIARAKHNDHPGWELSMARKDVRLALEEGAKSGHRMVAMPAAAAEMDRWIADGFGHADWAVFASAAVKG